MQFLVTAIEILKNDDGSLKALCFFTPDMIQSMKSWPEFLSMDATYCLINLDYQVILIIVVDGNGESHIVAICISSDESALTYEWFLQQFKKHHGSACDKIQCVMGDKDSLQRDVIYKILGVIVYICIWHSQKIFQRTVSTKEMGISKEER